MQRIKELEDKITVCSMFNALLNSTLPKGKSLLDGSIRRLFSEFEFHVDTDSELMLFTSVQAIRSKRDIDDIRWEFKNNNDQWIEALFINEMHFEYL